MKIYRALSITLILCLSSVAYPHSVPTHHNITHAGVDYLRDKDDQFSCFNDSQVQIGTGEEDNNPRYMFHFFPSLNAGPFSTTCSSLQWAFGSGSCKESGAPTSGGISNTLANDHNWQIAFDHAHEPGTTIPSDQGWTDFGYVLHLMEDLTSPAHVRNDPHPPYIDGDPVEAEDRVPGMPSGNLLSFSSPQDVFTSLQAWTRSNFFSKDTCFDPTMPGPTAASSDSRYFYDGGGHRIAYKSLRYKLSGLSDATRNRQYTTIDDTIADEQFGRLGPQAVLYAASFMRFYYEKAKPLISPVRNGSFEAGDFGGWSQDTQFRYNLTTSEDRQEGTYSARIGRWDQPYQQGGCFRCGSVPDAEPDGQDFIYQDIELPNDATRLELNFDYKVVTYDGADYDWFDMEVRDAQTGAVLMKPVDHVGGIINGSPSNWGLYYTTGWRFVSADLTAFKGRKVRLFFGVQQDGYGDQIATYVDKVAIDCRHD